MEKQNIIVAVTGASGKVGQELVRLIELPSSGMTSMRIVSDTSSKAVEDYIPLSEASLRDIDILIDFTTAEATMQILDRLNGSTIPVVIGTTGFSTEQTERLKAEGTRRPILVGANFTYGFETFLKASEGLLRALPEARVTVGETYNSKKKKVASGTTQRITRALEDIPKPEGETRCVVQDIQRFGDTAGINRIELSLGCATISLMLTVHSRQAYAAGALESARWLLNQPNGFYTPSDMIS